MNDWSAHVEWIDPELTDDQLMALWEQLRPASGSVGHAREQGRVGATISVTAGTLRQAVAAALATVEQAGRDVGVPVAPLQVEVLDESTFHGRLEVPQIPELVGAKEAAEILGVTQQRVSQLIREHADFPPAVAHPASGPVFIAEQVHAFNRRWERKRTGRPRKATSVSAGGAA